jgi:hypothetical protein
MDQPKRALIQMKNGPATKVHKVKYRRSTKSSLIRNILALNQHASAE